jgi:glucose-1-phosphate adenylyltransferase
MISEGCVIHGHVENSVISGGVEIARDAYVSNSVILADVKIESGARVCYSIVDSDSVIGAGVSVGKEDAEKSDITVVAKGSRLAASDNHEKGVTIS